MKKLLLLTVLFLGMVQAHAQDLMADEAVLAFFMRQRAAQNNHIFFYNDYEIYCTKFFAKEFYQAQNNEFVGKEFTDKMNSRFKGIYEGFDKGKSFYYVSYNTLKPYDFNSESFLCSGAGLPKFIYQYKSGTQLILNLNADNAEKFWDIKLSMKPDVAKRFLANNPTRRIYLVAHYVFTNVESGNEKVFNVSIKKVEIYGDKYLNALLKTIQ